MSTVYLPGIDVARGSGGALTSPPPSLSFNEPRQLGAKTGLPPETDGRRLRSPENGECCDCQERRRARRPSATSARSPTCRPPPAGHTGLSGRALPPAMASADRLRSGRSAGAEGARQALRRDRAQLNIPTGRPPASRICSPPTRCFSWGLARTTRNCVWPGALTSPARAIHPHGSSPRTDKSSPTSRSTCGERSALQRALSIELFGLCGRHGLDGSAIDDHVAHPTSLNRQARPGELILPETGRSMLPCPKDVLGSSRPPSIPIRPVATTHSSPSGEQSVASARSTGPIQIGGEFERPLGQQ